jgi:tetratricopeptide (TPR) repeat protein
MEISRTEFIDAARSMFPTLIIIIGLLLWFIADMNHASKLNRRRSELGAQGRWKELNEHFEAELTCWRMPLRIFRCFALPGGIEVEYAMHLYKQGELEKALEMADRAVVKSNRFRKHRDMPLIARAQILSGFGRYDEARLMLQQARKINPEVSFANLLEAMIEMYEGHIEQALALGQRALSDQKTTDSSRALVSALLTVKGRFQDALNILTYEPVRALALFTAEDLDLMTQTESGRQLVLAMDEEMAGVFRPVRYLAIAGVCLEAGDKENLEDSLNRAERELKSNPAIEHIYRRLRACCCAMKNEPTEMESHLARARQLANEFPSRSAKYETHQAAGRAYLLLQRNDAALTELRAAVGLALCPSERHYSNYWLGRAAEAAGQRQEAEKLFKSVITNGFDTWITADARRRIHASSAVDGPTDRNSSAIGAL